MAEITCNAPFRGKHPADNWHTNKRTLLIGYEKLARQFEMQHLDDTPESTGINTHGVVPIGGIYRRSRRDPSRVSEQSGTGAMKMACKAYSLDLQVNPIDG